jgi:hypothetical protein
MAVHSLSGHLFIGLAQQETDLRNYICDFELRGCCRHFWQFAFVADSLFNLDAGTARVFHGAQASTFDFIVKKGRPHWEKPTKHWTGNEGRDSGLKPRLNGRASSFGGNRIWKAHLILIAFVFAANRSVRNVYPNDGALFPVIPSVFGGDYGADRTTTKTEHPHPRSR